MADLFDISSPLLKAISPAFLRDFNAAESFRRVPPWLRRKAGDDVLIVAEYLRWCWNRAFEGLGNRTYVLAAERVLAVQQRIDQGLTVNQLAWAVVAYADECRTTWRLDRPTARKPFETFFRDARLDLYIDLGHKLARKRAAVGGRASRPSEQIT